MKCPYALMGCPIAPQLRALPNFDRPEGGVWAKFLCHVPPGAIRPTMQSVSDAI